MPNDLVPSLDDIPKGVEGIRFLLGVMYHRMGEMQDQMLKVSVEQNTVHDIVDTMSESVRLINTKVETMLPVVDNYRLNEKNINVAVTEAMKYRDETLVKSGIRSMLGYVITCLAVIGGAIGTLIIEGVKYYLNNKHG